MEQENDLLTEIVRAENPLKEMFVEYVGEKLQPPNGEVTVEMIVQVLANEFPEFLLVVAEENFIQGYKQAFVDMESSYEQNSGVSDIKQIDLFENPTE